MSLNQGVRGRRYCRTACRQRLRSEMRVPNARFPSPWSGAQQRQQGGRSSPGISHRSDHWATRQLLT